MAKKLIPFLLFVFLLYACPLNATAQNASDADYQLQGEYSGSIDDGEPVKYGIQVIALGEGKFTGVGFMGGLPGDGWDNSKPTRVENIAVDDGILTFEGEQATALISGGVATIQADGNSIGKLKRIVRNSPTLGAAAPANATILFNGKESLGNWELKGKPAKASDDGLLQSGTASKQKFQDHTIHIEFLLPFMPEARGQARGNSGIYLQGRYEVQMLDSFGLTGEQNECGGIYSIRKPDVNMCYPPMQWQTYDIDFVAAKYDGDQKVENARMSVKHNGVTIHENVELPQSTTAASIKDGSEPGFVYLQNHGNPVQFRNIWVVEKPPAQEEEGKEKIAPSIQTAELLDVQQPVKMHYLLSLPKDYASQEKWPLVLFLHGAGERGENLDQVKVHGPPKLVEQGKQFPFIVVSPQCPKNRWWEPVSLSALLDDVEKKYNVDSDRIYVTGLSMGGFGTWNLAAYSPERFAAIAPICGGGDSVRTAYTIGDQVPAWVFHGGKDGVVPVERSQELVDAFKKKNIDVKFTIYPDAGHDSWTETYNNEELYDWLLSHTRKHE